MAELVDNALDARAPDTPVAVDVDYNAREGWIRVRDDGTGMTRQQLADALVLGLSAKGHEKIGKFGLGMKTACTSLGERFDIWTARETATFAHVAAYDELRFIAANEWKLPIRRRKKDRSHGTTITIQSSRLYPNLHQSLLRNLGWTFRHFILDGLLSIRVNGIAVEAAGYEVDEASVLPFEGVVAGRAVRGWVGLLHKSSQRGWYGFGLIRHRRIIRRHEKIGFQPHPQTARVVGELHLDDFDTNNLKTDFIRETAEWRDLESWLSGQIEPVIAQSRALAHAGMLDLRIRAELEKERDRMLGSGDPLNMPGALKSKRAEEVSDSVAVAIGALHVEHVFAVRDADAPYADVSRSARRGEADLVTVETNLAHPAAGLIADRSGWACHNIAEAAAAELASREEQLRLKGILLAKLLGERALRRTLGETAREMLREEKPSLALRVEPSA